MLRVLALAHVKYSNFPSRVLLQIYEAIGLQTLKHHPSGTMARDPSGDTQSSNSLVLSLVGSTRMEARLRGTMVPPPSSYFVSLLPEEIDRKIRSRTNDDHLLDY